MINPNYTVDYFNIGDEVFYVPNHAVEEYAILISTDYPQWRFRKVERGIVKSKNDRFVFVHYYNGDELEETAKATSPTDLVIWKKS